jgi:hypothetical protein
VTFPVHVMFDLETLGVGDLAPIVQIGAVLFSPWGVPSDFDRAHPDMAPKAGAPEHHGEPDVGVISGQGGAFCRRVKFGAVDLLRADADTIRWWLTTPSDEARRRVFGEVGAGIHDVLKELDAWSLSWGVKPSYWWSGMDFDLRLLRQAGAAADGKRDWPWNHRKVGRDFRTLKWIGKGMGIESAPRVGVEHDAVDDCYHQAYYAIKVLRKLGVVGA